MNNSQRRIGVVYKVNNRAHDDPTAGRLICCYTSETTVDIIIININ